MEEVSAFAAYQNQNGGAAKKVATNKSPKANKQKKGYVQQPTVEPQKKRKLTENSGVQAHAQPQPQATASKASKTSAVTSSVAAVKGTAASSIAAKKKKTTQSQPIGVTMQQNGSAFASPSLSNSNVNLSSVAKGQDAFAHILHAPDNMDIKKFMKEHWEKRPLHITRRNNEHYDNLKVSTRTIDEMLRNNIVEFTKNLDITSYENGIRETHNPDGRALPGAVWEFYQNGCSVRLINPQTFIGPLHNYCATLQEYFHCLVGANVYLTPPNSQGFAPHYDDIEAFVLQIEGKKEWTLYPPRSENEKLPRESSGNFEQNEIGEPACQPIILTPGDMLYFPRGWIHQAKTVPNCHSLHITLSVYQKNSYAELFDELTKQALKNAIDTDIAFRRGVPVDIWNEFGETYSGCDSSERREAMKNVLTHMFNRLVNHLDFDAAVDKMAVKFQHDALPPVLNTAEKVRTTFGTAPLLHNNGKIEMPSMDEGTEVRLLRAHIVRLVKVDNAYHLYYYADNSKEYHGSDLNYIEVEEATVMCIKKLIQEYPKYTPIHSLSDNIEEAETVVLDLWDRGLLMTKKPLE
ncbi:bifunctional lysine-specific demethylase and histidyl-hydroxylase NO66 [Sitodiplosis mosellana]|uniref:bifunctional lysine-specific demethylase and histidyl-hydroxylase NO66 n=1 Tax=Sitodiplosis mosellana TaxID=263140 RepID=UPI002444E259|nr:bifunctional lysine-specific demethylase and histidyl-hydroxylase NO66 [Sitodiplosis mosellana]